MVMQRFVGGTPPQLLNLILPRQEKICDGFISRPKMEPVGRDKVAVQENSDIGISGPVAHERAAADVSHDLAVLDDVFAVTVVGIGQPEAEAAEGTVAQFCSPFVGIRIEVMPKSDRTVGIIIAD